MQALKRKLLLALLALAASAPLRAAMEIAPQLPPIKMGGFLHSWIDAGDDTTNAVGNREFKAGGSLLKRLRLRFAADPMDGVQVVIVPELAGGFTLLDGYVSLNWAQLALGEEAPGALAFTLGQFKTPFGQNRMYVPPQLTAVDYAGINRAIFGSTTFWDAGIMASYKSKLFDLPYKLDLAAVEGLGPNQANPNGSALGLKSSQDFSGRLEFGLLDGMLTLGGSAYQGTHFTTPGTQEFATGAPKLWSGAHFKLKGLPKTYNLEAEWINRDDAKAAYYVEPSYWVFHFLQIYGVYERYEDQLNHKLGSTRLGGGLAWLPRPSGLVKLTLQSFGDSTGPDQTPTISKHVLQTQVSF